ncbi:MAG: hypothetical protein IIA81_06215 [Thaumarchaeota archaeon]|nr:hypothetical protein [Nitrososphaerota archaeon]
MNKIFVIVVISVVIAGIVAIPAITEQFVDAKSRKKIHFTETITSSQDPGQGHESHQLALILSPNEGTLYVGSLTYTVSEPIQIVVLHEISDFQAGGQPIWTVDGSTIYGLSLIDQGASAGSFEFTGAALALHTSTPDQFTATVSVDGWIRGQPTEVIMQKIEIKKEEPTLLLSRTNVPATIPMHKGMYNNGTVHYIITDTNDQTHADIITQRQDWKVELAPPLSDTPNEALQTVYTFTDGVEGDGIHGYQQEVFSSTPVQTDEYSALGSITHVLWKIGQVPEVLDSVETIMEAEEDGRIKLEKTDIVINMPQIIWPEGQMVVKENKTLTDDMAYGGGQILDIDTEEMIVTFIAHRGWGPDGKTIYCIVTDATPTGPAEMMGVTDAPTAANLIDKAAAADLFQFSNGIKGSGPVGFQAGIAAAAPGDENYSPMWRIFMIEWNDPENAKLLETKADIDEFQSEDLISVNLARPMNSDHIVNCPFIDPFQ